MWVLFCSAMWVLFHGAMRVLFSNSRHMGAFWAWCHVGAFS
jgi:hypothetical protein